MTTELTVGQVRHTIDPQTLGFETTASLKLLEGIIGQKRAVSALQFGLGIDKVGFNTYVAGPPGIGKMTAVQSFLDQLARTQPVPPDWCYVNNFDEPYQPRVFSLPAGQGHILQQDMQSLIEQVRREIPKAFESDEYTMKRDEIKSELSKERERALADFAERAARSGFSLEVTPFGVALVPTRDGRPLREAEFDALPLAAREDIKHKHDNLQKELQTLMKQLRALDRSTAERMQELDKQVALYVVGGLIEDLKEKYESLAQVKTFIEAVQVDILENIDLFKKRKAGMLGNGDEMGLSNPLLNELPFRRFRVNVLVDNSKQQGAPVVVELNPTFSNLFGRIEKEMHLGALYTDLTMIKAGALHRANGGYLVVQIEDLLRGLYSWEGLKGALRSQQIEIEELSDRLGLVSTKSLKPQPIPLNIKVVLIGPSIYYYLLHALDGEFPQLFKVKADFDTQMARTDENRADLMAFIHTLCQKEKIQPLNAEAVAELLEHASRLAQDQAKFSTHFGALADVIREAGFWAQQEKANCITRAHVQRALDEKIYRSNLIQTRIEEMIARGSLLIDVQGERVGQVNGLSVLDLGNYWFGKPSRITATVGPGRERIVDIEREIELGGPIHSKGVLILSGYLREKFAPDAPLTLDARLVFEQSYEGVEGDSASSAELYALLSALADLPLKQNIAVTGSVNQHGIVQAIGGVNEKIEGFFDICRVKGFNPEQGVIIPQSNAQNLMLRADVVQAIRAGTFHIWTVNTIDDGIALLTGQPAEVVNLRVEKRLMEFGKRLKEFAPLPMTEEHPERIFTN